MFERDYLMRLIADLIQAWMKSVKLSTQEDNPYAAARLLETAIGEAVDMDAILFLSLTPESMASMMSISSMDAQGAGYVARSLALASVYNREAGDPALADMRMQQARAVASAYGVDLGHMDFPEGTTSAEAKEIMSEYTDD